MYYRHDGDDYVLQRPGWFARALCKLFGHTHDPIRYLRTGSRSVTDGIGRLHVNVQGECRRCGDMVEFGQLHVPNGPWEFDHATRQYVQTRREGAGRAMASWDAEHPHPVTLRELVDNDDTVELPPLREGDLPCGSVKNPRGLVGL